MLVFLRKQLSAFWSFLACVCLVSLIAALVFCFLPSFSGIVFAILQCFLRLVRTPLSFSVCFSSSRTGLSPTPWVRGEVCPFPLRCVSRFPLWLPLWFTEAAWEAQPALEQRGFELRGPAHARAPPGAAARSEGGWAWVPSGGRRATGGRPEDRTSGFDRVEARRP